MPVSLDEFPIHQAPLSMAHAATSDRNFYDRNYFFAHDRTGDVIVVSGFGVYPNLGVTDAFLTVRRGDRLITVRSSDVLTDRMAMAVGPYRIEVVEPLGTIRVVCDAAEHGIAADLTFTGSFPAVDEAHHQMRRGGRIWLDAMRFAQVGTWEGILAVDGDDITVSPDRWLGTRDRSWGIRPVGEPEPTGRPAEELGAQGFWWLYAPLRFDDFGIIVIVQEEPDGTRTLNDAKRVWPASTGRAPEQLGWPEVEFSYRPGSRHPERATIHLSEPAAGGRRRPFTVDVETLGFVPLNSGCGYGADPSWSHGQWRGPGWVDRYELDMTDPEVLARAAFAPVDHAGKATLDGQVGYGLFEHASIGRHDPTGFADFTSVAPT